MTKAKKLISFQLGTKNILVWMSATNMRRSRSKNQDHDL